MGMALGIAAIVLFYVALFAVFAAGSIGLVGAAIRTGERRGWPSWGRGALAIAAVAAALLGGWFVFAVVWPFRQLRKTRTPGLRRRLLYGAVALSVLLPSGCVAGTAVAGPCFFDPPPGDQLSLTIANDTAAAVTVVDCLDDSCAEAQSPTAVAAGRRASMPLEGCAGGTMGVLASGTGLLQSCVAEPTEDENGNLRSVAVSEGRPCPHARTGARVRIDDSGS
jgi:hypothetical protein